MILDMLTNVPQHVLSLAVLLLLFRSPLMDICPSQTNVDNQTNMKGKEYKIL